MNVKLRNATDQQNWLACLQAASSVMIPATDEERPKDVANLVAKIADALFEEMQGRMTS